MATKEKGAEAETAEEEKEILPELTGMPIEVHFRRHIRFIFFILFCLYLGWYTFALMLIAWVTGVRWAENQGHLQKYDMDLVWGRSFLMWRTDWGLSLIHISEPTRPERNYRIHPR